MKKTFPLQRPGKADERVRDSIKHDLRKYVTRERRKTLPEGFTLWEFDCKVGAAPASAEPKPLADLGHAVDAIAETGVSSIYVEILARPGHRPRPASSPPLAGS